MYFPIVNLQLHTLVFAYVQNRCVSATNANANAGVTQSQSPLKGRTRTSPDALALARPPRTRSPGQTDRQTRQSSSVRSFAKTTLIHPLGRGGEPQHLLLPRVCSYGRATSEPLDDRSSPKSSILSILVFILNLVGPSSAHAGVAAPRPGKVTKPRRRPLISRSLTLSYSSSSFLPSFSLSLFLFLFLFLFLSLCLWTLIFRQECILLVVMAVFSLAPRSIHIPSHLVSSHLISPRLVMKIKLVPWPQSVSHSHSLLLPHPHSLDWSLASAYSDT